MNRRETVFFLIGIALTALVLTLALGPSTVTVSAFQVSTQPTPTPTFTPVPPTPTFTPVPPTPTFTPVPPTPTFTPVPPTPTFTPVPPTPTFTPVPPTPTPPGTPPFVSVDEPLVTVDEGQVAANSGTVGDPDGTVASLAASPGEVTDNGDGTWSWAFATRDGPDESQTVVITAIDDAGNATSVTFELTVNNVSPIVDILLAPREPVAIDNPIDFTVVFTDPGVLDIHVAELAWGDGSSCLTAGHPDCSLVQGAGGGLVTGSHTYAESDVYEVTVAVADDDGGSGEAIYPYVVVYDADGGFVSGGGWIESLPGAYLPDPSLTGRATFGFVSKYQRGKTAPEGNTTFIFQAGGMKFFSDSYDWLVVNRAGTSAQFKGEGLINGEPAPGAEPYRFMLWGGDGRGPDGEDTFRIEIWYEVDDVETLIYDNVFDQPIGGGNIKVHRER